MAKFYYQGHGSYRTTSDEGVVIYVDPYAGDGYDLPADLIIVTHEHTDHNQVQLVNLKKDGVILRQNDLHKENYEIVEYKGILIEGTPACNKNHLRRESMIQLFCS